MQRERRGKVGKMRNKPEDTPKSLEELQKEFWRNNLEPIIKLAYLAAGRDDHKAQVQKRQNELLEAENRAAEHRRILVADERDVPMNPDIRAIAIPAIVECSEAINLVTKAVADAYTRKRAGLLFLSGGTGTGKTSALARAVTFHPLSARYFCASDLLVDKYKAQEQLKTLRQYKLLAIDELGLEPEPGAITELIVRGIDQGNTLVLAGNIGVSEFNLRYGDARVASRIQRIPGWARELKTKDMRTRKVKR